MFQILSAVECIATDAWPKIEQLPDQLPQRFEFGELARLSGSLPVGLERFADRDHLQEGPRD